MEMGSPAAVGAMRLVIERRGDGSRHNAFGGLRVWIRFGLALGFRACALNTVLRA